MSPTIHKARLQLAALRHSIQPVLGPPYTAGQRRKLSKPRLKARPALPALVAELLLHPELIPSWRSAAELQEAWSTTLDLERIVCEATELALALADTARRADQTVWKTVLDAYAAAKRAPIDGNAKRFAGRLAKLMKLGSREKKKLLVVANKTVTLKL